MDMGVNIMLWYGITSASASSCGTKSRKSCMIALYME